MSAKTRLGIDEVGAVTQQHYSRSQTQTRNAFSFKWSKRETYESVAMRESGKAWLIERYCGGDEDVVDGWLNGDRKIILDAGCGSGFSALLMFGDRLRNHDYLGVDISDAIDVAKARFAEAGIPGDFLQASLNDLAVPDESIDIIFSEGVLHHTDDTAESLSYLSQKLKSGGRFLFYVYAKKAVIREFTDDYVRAQLKNLDDEAAWDQLLPLTKLGKAIGDLGVEVDIQEAIPLLGIDVGKVDIQRLFYWSFLKAFYKPELSLDEMNHINFDWFRPLNCHRHTPDEVRRFCSEAGLEIERFDVQLSGITVVAVRS